MATTSIWAVKGWLGKVKSEDDRLLDEMMAAPAQKQEAAQENPTAARTEKSRPSEPSSKSRKRSFSRPLLSRSEYGIICESGGEPA